MKDAVHKKVSKDVLTGQQRTTLYLTLVTIKYFKIKLEKAVAEGKLKILNLPKKQFGYFNQFITYHYHYCRLDLYHEKMSGGGAGGGGQIFILANQKQNIFDEKTKISNF
jgi:cell division protease FtsH